ncbi:hypothetical protein AOLI_G00284860 [Acnodon oligacanthus]
MRCYSVPYAAHFNQSQHVSPSLQVRASQPVSFSGTGDFKSPSRCSFRLTSLVSPSIPIALPVDQPYSLLKKEVIQHGVE